VAQLFHCLAFWWFDAVGGGSFQKKSTKRTLSQSRPGRLPVKAVSIPVYCWTLRRELRPPVPWLKKCSKSPAKRAFQAASILAGIGGEDELARAEGACRCLHEALMDLAGAER
jgi:hypothetical protein